MGICIYRALWPYLDMQTSWVIWSFGHLVNTHIAIDALDFKGCTYMCALNVTWGTNGVYNKVKNHLCMALITGII